MNNSNQKALDNLKLVTALLWLGLFMKVTFSGYFEQNLLLRSSKIP